MKRTHQRFLSLLLALVMVFGLMPMGTLAFAAEGTGTDLGLTVTARYMTNRLTWNAESGVSYRVERSADNRSWEQLATVDAGSYLDETAEIPAALKMILENIQHVKGYSKEKGYLAYIGQDDFDWEETLRTAIKVGKSVVFDVEFGMRGDYDPFERAENGYKVVSKILESL